MSYEIESGAGPSTPSEWRRGYLAAKRIYDAHMRNSGIEQAVARYGTGDTPPTQDNWNAGWRAFFWCRSRGIEL